MSSSAMEATGAESEVEEDESNCVVENSNSVSSEPVAKKKGSDSSTSTTNDPSSTSATTTVVVRRPASQSKLQIIATAAADPPVPRRETKPRRAKFREEFQNTSTTSREETMVARHPTPQSSGLPSFAAAAAAAAPLVPLREKKPRRSGFREQFLQKLRVMLDRESQNDSTIVQWSTDGNSFIITDQTQFEADIIPTYFDNPIVFASFLSKLYRWGFSRLSSRQTGHYEFRSPTFRRLGADSAPAAAADNTFSNAGGGASIQVQQQQQQQHPNHPSSPSLQQVMAQINQPPPPNPLPSQADAIAELVSNFQRSSQQPLTPSQQSVLNQNSNQPKNTDATGILQSIVGSSIQMQQQPNQASSSSLLQQVMALINQPPPPIPLPSQADAIAELISNFQRSSQQPLTPSQHSALNHQLNVNLNLQPFQQRQHPNPTMNLLNTALSILVGSQTPSAHQRNAIQALMSLYGMSSRTGTFPNTNTSPAMPQPDHMAVQSLLMLMHRVREDERQRRVQADATQNAIIANIGQILGLGSEGIASLNVPRSNPTGTTVSVPHNIAYQAHQGIPSLFAGSLNFQADPIAAILQAARSKAGGQLEEVSPQTQLEPDNYGDNYGNDEGKGDHDGRPLSQKKRKSPEDGNGDEDNRPRKK